MRKLLKFIPTELDLPPTKLFCITDLSSNPTLELMMCRRQLFLLAANNFRRVSLAIFCCNFCCKYLQQNLQQKFVVNIYNKNHNKNYNKKKIAKMKSDEEASKIHSDRIGFAADKIILHHRSLVSSMVSILDCRSSSSWSFDDQDYSRHDGWLHQQQWRIQLRRG